MLCILNYIIAMERNPDEYKKIEENIDIEKTKLNKLCEDFNNKLDINKNQIKINDFVSNSQINFRYPEFKKFSKKLNDNSIAFLKFKQEIALKICNLSDYKDKIFEYCFKHVNELFMCNYRFLNNLEEILYSFYLLINNQNNIDFIVDVLLELNKKKFLNKKTLISCAEKIKLKYTDLTINFENFIITLLGFSKEVSNFDDDILIDICHRIKLEYTNLVLDNKNYNNIFFIDFFRNILSQVDIKDDVFDFNLNINDSLNNKLNLIFKSHIYSLHETLRELLDIINEIICYKYKLPDYTQRIRLKIEKLIKKENSEKILIIPN